MPRSSWRQLVTHEESGLGVIECSEVVAALTLILVGFLGVRFAVGGGVKLPRPCLKPVRIMLETSNLARKYRPICRSRKYTF